MTQKLNSSPVHEAHITLQKIPAERIATLLAALKDKGIEPKHVDFFQNVINLDKDPNFRGLVNAQGAKFSCGTPTGHDIHNPGAMITVTSGIDYDAHFTEATRSERSDSHYEIIRLVLEISSIAKNYADRNFNFEIELSLSSIYGFFYEDFLLPGIFLDRLRGYRRVQDAPLFENHIGWRGAQLPSHEEIVRSLIEITGFAPHQMVDFSVQPHSPVIDRVVTFYQATADATLALVPKLEEAKRVMGAAYATAEQVCIVGEPA